MTPSQTSGVPLLALLPELFHVQSALWPEYSPWESELPRTPVERSFRSHFGSPAEIARRPYFLFQPSWVAVTGPLRHQPLDLGVSVSETCVQSIHSPSYIRELIEQTFDTASSIAATTPSLNFSITLNAEISIEHVEGSGKPNFRAMSKTQIVR